MLDRNFRDGVFCHGCVYVMTIVWPPIEASLMCMFSIRFNDLHVLRLLINIAMILVLCILVYKCKVACCCDVNIDYLATSFFDGIDMNCPRLRCCGLFLVVDAIYACL